MTLENLLATRQFPGSGGKVPIRSVDDYNDAMRRLSAWFDDPPEPGSDAGKAFKALLTRVAEFERKHFPI